jgi:lipopolysaccharide/colanic/teichoic acid biosynthesis glycosyltransferase
MAFKLLPKETPFVKRLFDLALAIPSLFILSPLMVLIALLVGIFHGLPILFRQDRPGVRGEIFTIAG